MISSISPKALTALMAGAAGKVRLTRSELSKAFPGHGRDYWGAALTELEEAGFLERGSYQAGANKQWNHFEKITDLGWMYLRDWLPPMENHESTWGAADGLAVVGKPVVLISENQLINTNNKTYKASKEVREENLANEYKTVNMPVEGNLPYDFFKGNPAEDDYVRDGKEENLKYRAAKMEEGKTTFESRKSTTMRTRHNLAQELWGSNEVAFEFMERLTQHFHIKNNITIRLITGAFATMRKAQKTTALEEIKMLDLFFATTKFEKYDDGEHMWKLFIYRASELAVQAKRMVQSSDQKESASVQAAKSQEWLDG